MTKGRTFKITKYDYVIAAIAVIIVFFVPVFFLSQKASASGSEAKVFRNGLLLKEISLEKDCKVDLDGMVLEVKGGKIGIIESTCKKGLCKHFGFIGSPGQTIVCVPNKILVEIDGKALNDDYVAVSY